MTKGDLARQLARELGEDYDGDTSVQEIYQEWFDWGMRLVWKLFRLPDQNGTHSFSLVDGTSTYTLPASVGEISVIQLYPAGDSVISLTEESPLVLASRDESLAEEGEPAHFWYDGRDSSGKLKFRVWRTPNATYDAVSGVAFTFDSSPSLAAADTIPGSEFVRDAIEEAIRYRAAWSDGDPGRIQVARGDLLQFGLEPLSRVTLPAATGSRLDARLRGVPVQGVASGGLEQERFQR